MVRATHAAKDSNSERRAEASELAHLGRNVAAARRMRGITQGGLGARCGLSQGSISAIESDRQRPSLDQFFRIARALDVPIQRLIDGRERPGDDLRDIASQLRSLGIVDLHVSGAKVPGAFLRTEEVISLAVQPDEPDPRVILALPAVLAWNDWDYYALAYVCPDTNPSDPEHDVLWRTQRRISWLSDITVAIDQRRGFPGGCKNTQQLTSFKEQFRRNMSPHGHWHSLGRPMSKEPTSPIWRRWRINFDAQLSDFEERARQLVELGGGLRPNNP